MTEMTRAGRHSPSLKGAWGRSDVVLLTLDALRYDVAAETLASGKAPHLATLIPHGFERRHTPATFTFAAHQAFFAGFFPTPIGPGPHLRSIALRAAGSRTLGPDTLVMDAPSIVEGFRSGGYHTICIGGTTFFDSMSPLGCVMPGLFDEAHWSRELGVTSRRAPALQIRLAAQRLAALPAERRAFLFVNVSATHPPARIFVKGARHESTQTQLAALREVDRQLPLLLETLRARGGAVGIVCSDHGTCFGEDGLVGHRFAHDKILSVPYAEFELPSSQPHAEGS
jgi:hypothetical protein